jgi:hypothetical protein
LVGALWIVPVTLLTAAWFRARVKAKWPWVIVFFLLAAWLRSPFPAGQPIWNVFASVCVGGTLRVFRYSVPYWSWVIGERLEKAWVEAACSSGLTLVHRRRRHVVIDSVWVDYRMRHKGECDGRIHEVL